MLTQKQFSDIREELLTGKNPLFFFHDDPDGLCSFLLLYRLVGEGHGIVVKTTPNIDDKFIKKVEEYDPDKIFIVDIALVEQSFIDAVKKPIVWIDHHELVERDKVKYYNPRKQNPKDNAPVSYWCYRVVNQDLWISMVGAVGDWFIPDFYDDFKKQYPDLLEKDGNPGTILYETRLGKLVRIFSFILKGKTQDAMKCVKILTRIKTPYEILNQSTHAGKYLYKRFEKINQEYETILQDILKEKYHYHLIVYLYHADKMSFTGDLANELLYRFPDKIIILGREKSGEVKLSMRSSNINLLKILQKALVGINGYGGGHEYACGACVKREDFDRFIQNIQHQLKKDLYN